MADTLAPALLIPGKLQAIAKILDTALTPGLETDIVAVSLTKGEIALILCVLGPCLE